MSKVSEYDLLMQELEQENEWIEYQEQLKMTEEDIEEMAKGA